jgi:serine/threonine protein kinase
MFKNHIIQRELGHGGMATVYLAHDIKFDTHVAVKVLNKEYVHNDNIRNRFLSEARNMARMSHPNIIKVSDLIDDGDNVAFVLEYIEGETLKEYLERKGKLSDAEIKLLFTQMLDAVGYVHEQNLVHRDIKPSNFMLDKKGKVKLMDFGIAKNTDANSAEYTQTGTGMQMGTPMYMSPEQITETKSVTAQSDIYSLGVVLWQMAAGRKPYDTATLSPFQLQMKIVQEVLALTTTKWDLVIEKVTQKNVELRSQNCNEISSIIGALINENKIYLKNDATLIFNNVEMQLNKDYIQAINKENEPKWGITRKPTDWLLNPDYDYIEFIQEQNLFKVLQNETWGMIDINGNWILEPNLTNIGKFNELGIARAERNHEKGLINAKGEWVKELKSEGIDCAGKNWMIGNLSTQQFRNGTAIYFAQNATEWAQAAAQKTPSACFYDFEKKNGALGVFFNWFALNHQSGLSPEEWIVAGPTDFLEIKNALESKDLFSDFAKISQHGFYNTIGEFESTPDLSYYWTYRGTPDGGGQAVIVNNQTKKVSKISLAKSCGLLVRCIK